MWRAGLAELGASGIVDRALAEGATAPDFTLTDIHGKPVSLSDLLAQGNVVLKVVRGSWCPFCSMEFKAYKDAAPSLNDAGARLVILTPEADQTARTAFADAPFTVLVDPEQRVIEALGLKFELPPGLPAVHDAFGLDLGQLNAKGEWALPLPALYLLDQQGVVRYRFVDVVYTQRTEPSEVIERAKALRAL